MKRRDATRDAYIWDNYKIKIWRFPLKEVRQSFKNEFITQLITYAEEQIDA